MSEPGRAVGSPTIGATPADGPGRIESRHTALVERAWRWLFENRESGEITIVQFPNWPLWCIGAGWLAQWALPDGSTAGDVVGWAIRVLWLVWGFDELVRGVNPWRRLLGAAVIASQAIAIAATIG